MQGLRPLLTTSTSREGTVQHWNSLLLNSALRYYSDHELRSVSRGQLRSG